MKDEKPLGEFIHRENCRFCGSDEVVMFLNMGNVPLAGGFLAKNEIHNEKYYPLDLWFCKNCYLVQVMNVPNADKVFKRYFYFSSAIQTLSDHFSRYAKELSISFLPPGKSFAVEIGCNDGVFLKPLQELGIKCVGVDPAENVVAVAKQKGLTVVNNYFIEEVAKDIRNEYGMADAVLTSNSFAHIDDMDEVMRGIKVLLKDTGVLLIEVHYVRILLEQMQYDMIYHEHLSYYSLLTLEKFLKRYDMELFDVKETSIHGGSIRFYARNIGKRQEPVSETVTVLREKELKDKLDFVDTYLGFGERVNKTKGDLISLLERIKSENRKIVGYGASGRATIITNYCGIDSKYLEYVVDDSPAKVGYYMPGVHLPIKSWPSADYGKPDYVLVFAWSFINEIMKKRDAYLVSGGKFILPLPEVKIIPDA